MKTRTLLYTSLAFISLYSCNNQAINSEELDTFSLEDPIGIERATGVELLYSDSSIVRVRVLAPVLLRDKDPVKPKQIFPEGIAADFFNEYQNQTSKMVAEYGEQFTKEQKIYLKNNVHIWNTKKEHLEAEELTWDEMGKTIYSDKFVKITTPTQVIEGYKLRSNLEFTDWKLDSVKGITESKNMVDTPF
jgi:hypothetical protein